MKKTITFCTTVILVLAISYIAGYNADSPASNTDSKNVVQTIPFKLDRNRIIIPMRVNDSRELDLIFDSGMPFDGIYLFHKELAEILKSDSAMDVRVGGAGDGEASHAIMAENQVLTASGAVFDSQMVVISRSEGTQTFPTDGVIGWTLLGHYIVHIDFDMSSILLYDSAGFTPDSSWSAVDMTLKKNIPWIEATLATIEGEEVPVSVYLDIASGDALELLIKDDMKYTAPGELGSEYLGTGLSGDIYGGRGRTHMFKMGPHALYDIPSVLAPAEVRSKQEGADAIIGCHLLTRFNVIFDYFNNRIYIKPNNNFKTPFE